MASRYGLKICAATGGDAPGLAEMLVACDQPAIAARELGERIDALRAADGVALVAVEWGPPSGLVVMHRYRTLDAASAIAQITTLLVGPDERRRGIGRALLKAVSQSARIAGCDVLQLVAGPDQASLRAFCTATGFSESGGLFVRPLRKKG